MVSSPTDEEPLDTEQERKNVEQALEQLRAEGAVELTWLEDATLPALLDKLREAEFHIFHYIGHGGYKEVIKDGVLLLEDEGGRRHEVTSQQIGTILHDHDSLRLAVLNSCEGARTSDDDPFAGVAVTLVQQGIPAVIAMQFEITDRAAVVFARDLYSALAQGFPIDAALAEARKGIYADGNEVEWATPVLFMRTRDGRLFDVKTEAARGPRVRMWHRHRVAAPPSPPPAPPSPAPPTRHRRRGGIASASRWQRWSRPRSSSWAPWDSRSR